MFKWFSHEKWWFSKGYVGLLEGIPLYPTELHIEMGEMMIKHGKPVDFEVDYLTIFG